MIMMRNGAPTPLPTVTLRIVMFSVKLLVLLPTNEYINSAVKKCFFEVPQVELLGHNRAILHIVGLPSPPNIFLLAFLSTFWHSCLMCTLMCNNTH